jgi:hypothetical protein
VIRKRDEGVEEVIDLTECEPDVQDFAAVDETPDHDVLSKSMDGFNNLDGRAMRLADVPVVVSGELASVLGIHFFFKCVLTS